MGSPVPIGTSEIGPTEEGAHPIPRRSPAWLGAWLALLTLLAVALTAHGATSTGYPGYSAVRVTFWWLASIALLVTASARIDARVPPDIPAPLRWPHPSTLVPWVGMTLLAAVPRLAALERFPTVLDADEAAFMVHALQFQDRDMQDPFSTGDASNPLLLPAVQGIVASLLGNDIPSYRLPSAVLGIVGVLATWRLGARLAGEHAGIVAGALLATWPMHLHFSRTAFNNITDPAALAVGLLFTLRALDRCRAQDAVVAGVALGMSLYGYYGGRALGAVVVCVVLALMVTRRVPVRNALATGGWLVAGFTVAVIPIAVAFWRNPSELVGHLGLISTISVETIRNDPAGTASRYLPNLLDALVYPGAGNNLGAFRHERPSIGWPLTVLVIAGLFIVGRDALRRRDPRDVLVLLVPYLMLAAGIALTIPIAAQRYLAVIPLLAILAGAGLLVLVRFAARLLSSQEAIARNVLAGTLVLALGASNLRWFASEDRQLETYGDLRTTSMWDLGWRIREGDGAISRLLLAGAPYMFAYGFPNLTFLAGDVAQEDIPGAFIAGVGTPALPEDTILVLVREREGERCAIEAAYPDAIVAEARARDGSLLYIAYVPAATGGLARAQTPAETTLTVVHDSPCSPPA